MAFSSVLDAKGDQGLKPWSPFFFGFFSWLVVWEFNTKEDLNVTNLSFQGTDHVKNNGYHKCILKILPLL